MKKLRNLIYIFFLSLIFVFNLNEDVYASTTFESKYWIIDKEAGAGSYYARYGHIKITGDVRVVMCLFDNGKHVTYKPIIYSDTYKGNVAVWCGGNHAGGNANNLEVAKNLSDYYSVNGTISNYKTLVDLANEPTYCIYNTWSYSFNEYGSYGRNNLNFDTTDVPKFYYYEEGATLNSQDMFVNAFNAYIGGNTSDFIVSDGNITPTKNVKYDLELPLNIKVKQKSLIDLWIIEFGQDDPLYFTWEQNDPSYTKWTTEIYVSCSGSVKKHWYSIKEEEFETDFIYYTSVDTYKLKYTFDISKDEILDAYIKEQVGDYYSASCKPKFMFRNSWYDSSSSIQHYSNYVYSDNTTPSEAGANPEYNSFELDGESIDSNGISSDNISDSIINDSEYYDGSSSVGADSTTSGAISVLKGVFNDVLQFPDFFKSVLDFLPDTIMTVFGATFIILIGIAFVKIVV